MEHDTTHRNCQYFIGWGYKSKSNRLFVLGTKQGMEKSPHPHPAETLKPLKVYNHLNVPYPKERRFFFSLFFIALFLFHKDTENFTIK